MMDLLSQKRIQNFAGSGEFFGTRQHGLPEFKIANLFEDRELLKGIQSVAIKIIEDDPNLEEEKNKRLKEIVEKKFQSGIEMQVKKCLYLMMYMKCAKKYQKGK